MPFPTPETVGYYPGTIAGQTALTSGPTITPEFAAQIEQMRQQYAMMGQQSPYPEAVVGADAMEYLTNLSFSGNSSDAANFAAQLGISPEDLNANVTRVNQEAQANRNGGVFQDIGNLSRIGRGEATGPLDFFRDAAALGAIGYGTSFLPGAGGTGTATVTGSNTAAGAAGGSGASLGAIEGWAPAAAAGGGAPVAGGASLGAIEGWAPAAASGAAAGGNFLNNWLPYITGGVNTLLGVDAAGDAADAESAALQAAIDEQRRQYDTTRADLAPWMTAGQGALNRLQDPNAYTASPDYNFIRGEGMRDIGNQFSAQGGAQSGNALRALGEYTTNLAAGDYNNWWNRQAGLAGVGQNTALNLGNQGQRSVENVGNYLAGQGASRASGIWDRNALLAGGLNQGVSNWLYRRRNP